MDQFLQRRLVISIGHARPPRFGNERPEFPHDERPRGLDSPVQVDRGDERFVTVGEQRLLAAPAGFLFTAPEQHVLAEIESLGLLRERRSRDQGSLHLRFLSFVELGKIAEQHVGDDEPEHGVAQELHRFVVADAAADVLVGARGVRHRVLEQSAIAEAVADGLLERLELVSQPHQASVGQLAAVTLDDAARLLRVVGMHRQPHLAEPVYRQRKNRMRHVGADDRHHAVRFEQAAHDASLDRRRAAEDDRQIRQQPPPLRPP